MEPIQTGRLILRNFRPEDWEDLYEMIVQYRATESAKYDHPWPEAVEEYPKIAGWFAEGDSYLAVCLPDTGKVIGFVALNPEDGESGPAFNLGYIFNSDYHGQGYAYEACQAAVERAFDVLGAVKLVTGTPLFNLPSVRLLEKLGFTGLGDGRFTLPREAWLARQRIMKGEAK